MKRRICLVSMILASLLVWLVRAEDAKQTNTKPDDAKINGLIKQLGDDNWETRDKAQNDLIEYGGKLFEQYKKVRNEAKSKENDKELAKLLAEIKHLAESLNEASKSIDLEIKTRAIHINGILRKLLRNEIVYVEWAAMTGKSAKQELYVADYNGENKRLLIFHDTIPAAGGGYMLMTGNPEWSPDGKRIAFNMNTNNECEIFIISREGTGRKQLTNNGGYNLNPRWSPDGKKILFLSNKDAQDKTTEKYELFTVDADGENLTQLTKNRRQNVSPSWSPDGKKIAFVSYIKEMPELHIMDSDGKNQVRLTNDISFQDENDELGELLWSLNTINWSPNNKKIAFAFRNKEGFRRIYLIDSNGQNLKKLTDAKDDENIYEGEPCWSSDGQKIAFWLVDKAAMSLFTSDINDKNTQKVTVLNDYGHDKNPMRIPKLKWSPDNKWFLLLGYAPKDEKPSGIYSVGIYDILGRNKKFLTTLSSYADFSPSFPEELSKLFAPKEDKK
ncbi:MAG: PD40 domain-containing protein [Planctomycetes bacterium]|nr:PD40 domain-containing protein [Planctomycetota bacterium]